MTRQADTEGCLMKCTEKAPLIASLDLVNQVGSWIKLWNTAESWDSSHSS